MEKKKLNFILESKQPLALPTTNTFIKTYQLENSDFRVVFVDVPGPLVSCSIVIPTLSNDNKGLPHTLEHLIFCGSESMPHRGYLDNLATRCLSTGTNAYTAEDHTCYEITTAGSEGMLQIFPVFLDHVLNPTLIESQFMTEVYHLDGEGKEQGVVFCEMASRENTEADLLDLNLRKLLYQNQTTYSFECGGLTPDIANLTNQEIIDYHKKFYHLNNCYVIMCGQIRPSDLFEELEKFPFIHQGITSKWEPLQIQLPATIPGKLVSKNVPFPSDSEDVGSIGYGWKGPPSEDVKTTVALEVLYRYFNDNPSSPFPQRFTEKSTPFANYIDLSSKNHLDSPITLIFSGVPYKQSHQDSEMEGESEEDEEYSDDDSMDGESEKSTMDQDLPDLFAPGVYHKMVIECIHDFVVNGFKQPGGMTPTIKRHLLKTSEELEDSPHETIAMNLVIDIIRYSFGQNSSLKDTKVQGGTPKIGLGMQVMSILDLLEKEPDSYWQQLAKQYFLDQPACEIFMIPDVELSNKLTENKLTKEQSRVKAIGPKGLLELKAKVDQAILENQVNLTAQVISRMPPIPDVSKASTIRSQMQIIDYESLDDGFGFSSCQIIHTETGFCHLGLAMNIEQLPKHLRPYLVLFQELFFTCPLELWLFNNNITKMNYQQVAQYASELFVSHECGVGLGNSIFSTGSLSELVTIFVTAKPSEWETMIRFVVQVLMFSKFTKDRIMTTAKNLISSVSDTKNDGSAALNAVVTRITQYNSIDSDISIFKQESFLKSVVEDCKNGGSKSVQMLDQLREFLVNSPGPSFIRVGVPFYFSVINARSTTNDVDIAQDIKRIWISEREKLNTFEKKRKLNTAELKPAFPFPRTAYSLDQVDQSFAKSLIVPIAGMTTSYLCQIVECDLLTNRADFFPTMLVSELLSRAEGPLYCGIRGKGYAYGANVNCYLWAGQLSIDIYRSSEPSKALAVFHDLIKYISTDKGFEETFTEFEIDTAQAGIAYRWASDGATASSLLSTALRASLRGYKDIKDYQSVIRELYQVTKADLKRVIETYFKLFLLEDMRVTVVTSPGGDETAQVCEGFGKGYQVRKLEDFQVV
ncbi:hypothetical protein HK103_006844 [Boothiomyces macroporosus]|uniref:Uncharacterized protein n=1 Tax=Boothiomyces macroporosus TaxID=261099 RepID=A0AAD5Y4B8_9FUNG|nr:hypothetical protein HK103_006844 [Boothiomyces macroporosus]